MVPEQNVPNYTITGQDVMYLMKRSGLKIYRKVRYRYKALPLPLKMPKDATATLIALETPFPSPLDVVHAMERRAPLLVQVKAGVFMIQPDGSIEKLPEDDLRVKELKN